MPTPPSPVVLFDTLSYLSTKTPSHLKSAWKIEEYHHALTFLKAYTGSSGTFNSYRREIERLLQWSWCIQKKSIRQLKREDLEAYIAFCQKPPASWIGIKKVPRFIDKNGIRKPNPAWRPFVSTVSKIAHQDGKKPKIKQFKLTATALKDMFAILNSFYHFLMQEAYATFNPIALIRQKSKFLKTPPSTKKIRRLSELQWEYLLATVTKMADEDPVQYERSLFMISALYAMYLRISELSAQPRWVPLMHHFHQDHDGNWWFTTVGKGHKERQIAVSQAMLKALKRWRKFLGLSPLPAVSDNTPLIPKKTGTGALNSINHIRRAVQICFDAAMAQLRHDGFIEEAESFGPATVHWLRHTGISDDVKRRPREHVRDDAGHSSGATTDKYIDVTLKERHRSAKNKPMGE